MDHTIGMLIDKLSLKPHPEGGYYREVHRSAGVIPHTALDGTFKGDRNYSTSIYFLLTSATFSAFHRIRQDELWHFYIGSPIHVHIIDDLGNLQTQTVGNDIAAGNHLQLVVPAGCWFASGVTKPDAFSLVGCTVSPGFDFNDFELGTRAQLIRDYPQHADLIKAFTRE